MREVDRNARFAGAERPGHPGCHVRRQVFREFGRRHETEVVEFVLLQHDLREVAEHAAVENEGEHRLGPQPRGGDPVQGEQRSRRQVKPDFLAHLAGASVLGGLTILEDAARQGPQLAVVRLDQQDLARRRGDERGRRSVHRCQRRVPGRLVGERHGTRLTTSVRAHGGWSPR
jgi:hypothetical protein